MLFVHGDGGVCVRAAAAATAAPALKSPHAIDIFPAHKIAAAHCDSNQKKMNQKYSPVTKEIKDSNFYGCQHRCEKFDACAFFTYYDDGRCHFSAAGAKAVDAKGATSGQICGRAGADP